MARIFITGSADGLGVITAKSLIKNGHKVVIHARNPTRAAVARKAVPGAEDCLIADLSSIAETKRLAEEVNKLGHFDAVIHNAGLGYQQPGRGETVDGLPSVFAVNSLAPYILTCLIEKPKRLVYLSSGLHTSGDASLKDLTWQSKRWNGFQAYSDSKLHDVFLANAVARRWPDVYSNSVDPGWVATKMGGAGAPENLQMGGETQAWLAVSDDQEAKVTGKHFKHEKARLPLKAALDTKLQDEFMKECERLSGVKLPS